MAIDPLDRQQLQDIGNRLKLSEDYFNALIDYLHDGFGVTALQMHSNFNYLYETQSVDRDAYVTEFWIGMCVGNHFRTSCDPACNSIKP
jgi:hypothetical protein